MPLKDYKTPTKYLIPLDWRAIRTKRLKIAEAGLQKIIDELIRDGMTRPDALSLIYELVKP